VADAALAPPRAGETSWIAIAFVLPHCEQNASVRESQGSTPGASAVDSSTPKSPRSTIDARSAGPASGSKRARSRTSVHHVPHASQYTRSWLRCEVTSVAEPTMKTSSPAHAAASGQPATGSVELERLHDPCSSTARIATSASGSNRAGVDSAPSVANTLPSQACHAASHAIPAKATELHRKTRRLRTWNRFIRATSRRPTQAPRTSGRRRRALTHGSAKERYA
jgi:hypothetical protein